MLAYLTGNPSYSIISGSGKCTHVLAGGNTLSESNNLDTVEEGWIWQPDLNLLLVKANHPKETVKIEISS